MSSFRANNHKFEEVDTQVLGISADSQHVQRAYSASLGTIPYPILSDFHPHGEVAKAYDVYMENAGAPRRSVFLIDKEGVLRHKETYTRATDIDIDDLVDRASKL